MATVSNPYDTLFNNLKETFTYVENGYECNLGESMLLKAQELEQPESMLPVATTYVSENAFTAIAAYVNDRLTVTAAPKKNNTMRSFPIRSSFSAIFSAVAACALVFSVGIFALTGNHVGTLSANQQEIEIDETVENDPPIYEINK